MIQSLKQTPEKPCTLETSSNTKIRMDSMTSKYILDCSSSRLNSSSTHASLLLDLKGCTQAWIKLPQNSIQVQAIVNLSLVRSSSNMTWKKKFTRALHSSSLLLKSRVQHLLRIVWNLNTEKLLLKFRN